MAPIIASFIGWSNTGKTGFIEALLRDLSAAGVSPAAVKCVRHPGSFNLPGKDGTRFFEAGAAAALISETETLVSLPAPLEWDADYVAGLFPRARVILIEGKIVRGAVRVLVGGDAEDVDGLKGPLRDFDAIVTGKPGLAKIAASAGLAAFAPDEGARFIKTYLRRNDMDTREVSVLINGVDVPLNPFVRETIESVVVGLVKPLKKSDPSAEITIRIGPARSD